MKNTMKKLLLLMAVVAVMTAALVVSTSAYINWDAAKGTFPGGTASSYADINNENWVQVAAPAAVDDGSDGVYTNKGDLAKGYDCNAYFNESTGTLVIEMTREGAPFTGSSGDNGKAQMLASWCKLNATKVTTLEFRNIALFNNAGYTLDQLSSVKTVKIDAGCTVWSGTKNGTAVFYNLASMDTLLWGEWDKATGKFTKTRGEEGVVDLRGFLHLNIASTTYNETHTIMYAGSAVAGSGAKKVILPYSQVLRDQNRTYNKVVVSDGSATYTDVNKHASNTNYGKVIAEGKPCTVLKNKETGELGYTTYWAIDTTTWSNVTVKAAEDEFGGDYTGIIPYRFAMNAAELTTVVVPAEATLKLIEASAFAGCTSLRCITVEGKIDPALVIEADAFSGVGNGCIIQCANAADIEVLNNILATAGITNVKAVDMSVEPTPAPKVTKLPVSPAFTEFDPTGATAYGTLNSSYTDNYWAYYAETKTLKIVAKTGKSYNEVGSIATAEDGTGWTAYKEEIEHVVIGPKIHKLTAAFAAGMTNLKDIEMTADITQASGSFSDNPNLTTIFLTGMEKVEGQAMLAGAKLNFKLNLSGTAVKSIHMGSSAWAFIGNITPGPKTTTLIFDVPSDEIIAYCRDNYLNIQNSGGETLGEWYVEVPEGLPFCGNTAVYDFDAETGTLSILGKGAVGDVANYWGGGSKNQFWFDVKKEIKHVIIGDHITAIGKYAFTECENLETVQLPAVDGFIILNAAFEDCYNLKSVYIKGSEPIEGTVDISTLHEVESYMFADCFLIANAVINENVNKIGVSVFENCVNLQNIYGVPGSFAEEYATKNELSFFDTATNTPQPIKCEPPAPETSDTEAPETTPAPETTETVAPDTSDTVAPDTTGAPTPGTQPVGTEPGDSEGGSNILPIIIVIAAVVVVAIVVVVVIIAKKKAPKAEKKDEE